jgi:hypothetical protein
MSHSTGESHRSSRDDRSPRHAFANFLVALMLLAAAWAWARWAPIRRAPEFEFEEVSIGVNLLIAGAVPWFVQWAGVTCLLVGLFSFRWGLDRRVVLTAAAVPLIVGAAWWIGIVAVHWSEDPLEAMVTMFAQEFARRQGGGSLGQGVLHEVLGPLTAPLLLSGPYSLVGWNFLLTALSTAAVICLWLPLARAGKGKEPRLGVYGIVLCVWLLPVVIRAVTRVVEAL